MKELEGVYHSAKIRNFKQITTGWLFLFIQRKVFITLQRYEILSKSQQQKENTITLIRCLSLCKDTKF